ncbi:MAG: addiction module protein [Chthoniobacterales bacterium]
MSVAEIKQELTRLTDAERFELLDAIWDLIENKDDIPSPAWHAEELERREQEIASGEAKFIPWEEAKADILRRTS